VTLRERARLQRPSGGAAHERHDLGLPYRAVERVHVPGAIARRRQDVERGLPLHPADIAERPPRALAEGRGACGEGREREEERAKSTGHGTRSIVVSRHMSRHPGVAFFVFAAIAVTSPALAAEGAEETSPHPAAATETPEPTLIPKSVFGFV